MSRDRMFTMTLLFVGLVSALHGQNITTFGVPNAVYTNPTDINAAGEVTGDYSGTDTVHHGFLRDKAGYITTFSVPGSTGTFPTAINAQGEVIGYSYGPVDQLSPLDENYVRGFIRTQSGSIQLFDSCGLAPANFPQVASTYPEAFNAFGEVVGRCSQEVDIDTYNFAFIRQPNGTSSPIAIPSPCVFAPVGFSNAIAINPVGEATGSCAGPAGPTLGFLTSPNGITNTFNVDPVIETSQTDPAAINPEGQITGSYTDVHGVEQAFLRQPDGSFSLFSVGTALATKPQAIGPSGRIVGFWVDGNSEDHGFIRRENDTTVSFDVPGAINTNPIALKGGWITGYYSEANGTIRGFVVRPQQPLALLLGELLSLP